MKNTVLDLKIFSGIHHIGIYVYDIKKSLYLFTCNKMKIERDTGTKGLGSKYIKFISEVTGIKCSNARIIFLKGSGIRIELIQFFSPGNCLIKTKPLKVNGKHIAFIVNDIYNVYKKLTQIGMQFISIPLEIPGGVLKSGYSAYFIDSSDNKFELIQIPKK